MANFLHTLVKNVKLLVLLCSFFMLNSIFAQAPVAGYDYLGSCGSHHYYISKSFVSGLGIAGTVNDFRTKTGAGPNDAYAAAIVNKTENDCVQALMEAYNQLKYGAVAPPVTSPLYSNLSPGNKSTYPNWGDARNPWIGLTDVQLEGALNFVWSNGQQSCEDFRNWNKGEPNNYVGNVSNGEDFTQMLIMNNYNFDAANPNHDPGGKWNDWFNDRIIDPSGADLNITRLPVIVEVGPFDCQTNRGNLGCSHGYWKNASDKSWNEVGGLSRLAKFSNVFGITNGRGVIVLGVTTMQQALELKASGYNQVAKQGVAALMNANSGIYPYTSAEVIAAVQSIFNNGNASLPNITVNGKNYTGGSWTDATKFASYLDKLNNLGCPINNHGDMSSRQPVQETIINSAEKTFAVSGYPNPSRSNFSININGLSTEKVSVRVTDMTGRLVEQRTNVSPNQIITLGNNYRAGLYYVEVTQGENKQELKLIKQ